MSSAAAPRHLAARARATSSRRTTVTRGGASRQQQLATWRKEDDKQRVHVARLQDEDVDVVVVWREALGSRWSEVRVRAGAAAEMLLPSHHHQMVIRWSSYGHQRDTRIEIA